MDFMVLLRTALGIPGSSIAVILSWVCGCICFDHFGIIDTSCGAVSHVCSGVFCASLISSMQYLGASLAADIATVARIVPAWILHLAFDFVRVHLETHE